MLGQNTRCSTQSRFLFDEPLAAWRQEHAVLEATLLPPPDERRRVEEYNAIRLARVPADVCPVLHAYVNEMYRSEAGGPRARYAAALPGTRAGAAVEGRRVFRAADWVMRTAAPPIFEHAGVAPVAAALLRTSPPIVDLESAHDIWSQVLRATRDRDWRINDEDRRDRGDVWRYDPEDCFGEGDRLRELRSSLYRRMGLRQAEAAIHWLPEVSYGLGFASVRLQDAMGTIALHHASFHDATMAWEPVARVLDPLQLELLDELFAM